MPTCGFTSSQLEFKSIYGWKCFKFKVGTAVVAAAMAVKGNDIHDDAFTLAFMGKIHCQTYNRSHHKFNTTSTSIRMTNLCEQTIEYAYVWVCSLHVCMFAARFEHIECRRALLVWQVRSLFSPDLFFFCTVSGARFSFNEQICYL